MVRRGVVHGVQISGPSGSSNCEGCVAGKDQRAPIPKIRFITRARGTLDLIHTDVCVPIEVISIGAARHFTTFIDDHSNWIVVYPISRKSDAADRFKIFQKFAERQTGRKICAMQSDRGGEYLSEDLKSHLVKCGIKHRLTAANTSEQKGTAERMNRTLVTSIRSMLHKKKST